jgi:hypothetical protein
MTKIYPPSFDPTVCFRDLANLICQRWFNFKLEPIFDTAPAASKNEARFKSGQSQLKNNHPAT